MVKNTKNEITDADICILDGDGFYPDVDLEELKTIKGEDPSWHANSLNLVRTPKDKLFDRKTI